jgi:hypothetical protein
MQRRGARERRQPARLTYAAAQPVEEVPSDSNNAAEQPSASASEDQAVEELGHTSSASDSAAIVAGGAEEQVAPPPPPAGALQQRPRKRARVASATPERAAPAGARAAPEPPAPGPPGPPAGADTPQSGVRQPRRAHDPAGRPAPAPAAAGVAVPGAVLRPVSAACCAPPGVLFPPVRWRQPRTDWSLRLTYLRSVASTPCSA